MAVCPKCGSLLLVSYESIYECSQCDFMIRISKFQKDIEAAEEPWYIRVCNNESLWLKGELQEYPSIIAHEYSRLYDLLKKGQTYGAFFQLKDLLEVLLKFPILIAMSSIYRKDNKSIDEMELVAASFQKTLGLGDWRKIINIIYKKNLFKDPIVYPILEDVRNIYFDEKLDIVKWRNETIGHGALKFDSDSDFQLEIIDRLQVVRNHMEKCSEYYKKLNLYIKKNDEKIVLKGIEKARNLPVDTDIFLDTGLTVQKLYPYMLVDKGEIFFYDTFIDKKLKVSILNYPNGDKKDIVKDPITDYYHDLYTESIKALKKAGNAEHLILSNDSIEEEDYLAESERTLNEIRNIADYTNPQHVEDWLRGRLASSNKGIFLLQMERGMGKTTIAKAIDQNGFSKINLEDFSVRGYYINDTYLSDINYFYSGISDLFRTNGEGKIIIKEKKLKVLSGDVLSIKRDFCDLLFEYKEKFGKYFGKNKLLLIIDGLDELPNNLDKNFLNILPQQDDLNEGVYILLTSRTNEELPLHLLEGINNLNIPVENRIVFDRYSKENYELLKSYTVQELGIKNNDRINLLINKAEHRFLYLSMLRTIIKDLGEDTIELLPQGEALFDKFLDKLKFYFGDKYFNGLQKVLCIIASAREPLTVKEIANLYGEDKITFKLLSYLYEIQGVLRSERSYRGNLLSISHIELKNLIMSKYEAITTKLLKEWINKLSQVDSNENQPISEGEFYLISNIFNYAELGLDIDYSPILNELFPLFLIKEAERCSATQYEIHNRRRYYAIYSQLIKFQKLSSGKIDELKLYFLQAVGNSKLADALFENIEMDYEAAVEKYTDAINHRQLLLSNVYDIEINHIFKEESKREAYSEAELLIIKEIAEDYVNIGRVYYRVGAIQEAIKYCFKGIRLYNKYVNLEDEEDKLKLSIALVELARIYSVSYKLDNNFELALETANKALRFQEELLQSGMEVEGFIARTEECIGTTYNLMEDSNRALSMFKNALQRLKKPCNAAEMDCKRFITVLNNKIGTIYQQNRDFNASIPYFVSTVELFLEFQSLNIEYETTYYIDAHKCLGMAYLDIGEYKNSIEHFEKAFELYENNVSLLKSGEGSNYKFRFHGYMGMADSLYLSKKYKECLNYYDKWLEVISTEGSSISVKDLHVTLKRMYEACKYTGKTKQSKLQYSRLEILEDKFLRRKASLNISDLKYVLNPQEDISTPEVNNKRHRGFPYGYFIVDKMKHKVIKCCEAAIPLECRYSDSKKTFSVKFDYKNCEKCKLVGCPAKKNNGIVKFSEKIWLASN